MSRRRTTRVPRYCFDSSLFVSFFMNEMPRGRDVLQLLKQAEEGKVEIIYSYGALPKIQKESEATVEGDRLTQEDIDLFFEREEIQMVAVDRIIGEKARAIRLQGPKGMSATDAILVATALVHEADALFTDDEHHLLKYDGKFEGLKISRPFWQGQTSFLDQ